MGTKEYHWGHVVDNADPERRGRLTIICPTIAEDDNLEWVEPCFHFVDSAGEAGSFWIPTVGSMVEVEIDSSADGGGRPELNPKWRCSIYPDGTVPGEFSDEDHYPERRGWKTRAGHVMYFDDSNGSETFYYKHPSGTEILVDDAGTIKLRGSVEIGVDPSEPCVLGTALRTYVNASIVNIFNSHTHAGHGVAPAVPMTSMSTTVLSSTNKVK